MNCSLLMVPLQRKGFLQVEDEARAADRRQSRETAVLDRFLQRLHDQVVLGDLQQQQQRFQHFQ